MTNARTNTADIRKVLADSGIPELSDTVVGIMSGATSAMRVGSCADATPADGVIVDCDFQPGATLEWMAYRPNIARGDRTPGRLERLRWAGRSPFRAFLFRVTNNNRIYTFVVPKPCSNLSLMSVVDIPRPPAPPPPTPPAPAPPPPAVVVPPPPPPAPPAPQVQPPPPPPPAPAAGRSSPLFLDLLVGKDRRVRPIAGRETGDGLPVIANAGASDFAQCSPAIGVKLGVAKRFANDWEIAGAAGVSFSLVHGDDKVQEHQFLIDVEANKYLNSGWFIGTGLSFWDITHSDTFTPAWLLHVGAPIRRSVDNPIYFLLESRLMLDHADDIRNNYQFWGGVRMHF